MGHLERQEDSQERAQERGELTMSHHCWRGGGRGRSKWKQGGSSFEKLGYEGRRAMGRSWRMVTEHKCPCFSPRNRLHMRLRSEFLHFTSKEAVAHVTEKAQGRGSL